MEMPAWGLFAKGAAGSEHSWSRRQAMWTANKQGQGDEPPQAPWNLHIPKGPMTCPQMPRPRRGVTSLLGPGRQTRSCRASVLVCSDSFPFLILPFWNRNVCSLLLYLAPIVTCSLNFASIHR